MIHGYSGLIIIISAPSGAGKTTLCRKLLERHPELLCSVSYTTRYRRPEEKDGEDYVFIDRDDFLKKTGQDFFAEWAEVHGFLYGTPRARLEENVKKGRDVILTIDVQGAAQIKKNYPGAVSIFILSPTFEDLKSRLEKRKTEKKADIEKRLGQARKEIEFSDKFDYTVVNHTIEESLKRLEEILAIEKSKTKK